MLEKIGLPAKPSMRGNNWVVDASHCQGCSSQFTFINRKHHCRRCGGLFCNSCSQQRMVLRGQGDTPVRICDPCKKLEEAARFEMRHGHKNRTGRGGSKLTLKYEDEVLNQILGTDVKQPSLSQRESTSTNLVTNLRRGTSNASCSSLLEEAATEDGKGDILSPGDHTPDEIVSSSPEKLHQQALEEKKKYRILKGEGKPDEALLAFKRGKELERQAKALEVALRKNHRKALSSSSLASVQSTNDDPEESGRKSKFSSQTSKARNDDLGAELRELGWSDADLHATDKKPAKMTLEGELSTLLGQVHKKSGVGTRTGGIDKTQVLALKKKALMFKREGKLLEAKEELKRAKVLEKQLEEQEFLVEAEDSDDELLSLINSMDDGKEADLFMPNEQDAGFDFDHLVNVSDDLVLDGDSEVMDEDMDDPEIAAALKSLGWTEDSEHPEVTAPQSAHVDEKALLNEVISLKKEAINKKRAGYVAEATTLLRKAKLLERDIESLQSQGNNSIAPNPTMQKRLTSQTAEGSSKSMQVDDGMVALTDADPKLPPKSKLMIQKELLGLKKKALALRREGRLDEAEEELKKGRVLECQLEDMESASKVRTTKVNLGGKDSESVLKHTVISGTVGLGEEVDEGEVTEQDMHDPALLSLLENLGWKDEDRPKRIVNRHEHVTDSVVHISSEIPAVAPKRSKAEIQRELLSLKRKALTLRRQGEAEKAEEVLRMAKVLEAQMVEVEVPKREMLSNSADKETDRFGSLIAEEAHGNAYVAWKDEDRPKRVGNHSEHTTDSTIVHTSSEIPVVAPKRSNAEIQRELLGLKRKALTLRRQGEVEEAEEVLRMAKVLEAQMAEVEVPKQEMLKNSADKETTDHFRSLIAQEAHGNAHSMWESETTKPPPRNSVEEDILKQDMHDPSLLSQLNNLGWKDDDVEPVSMVTKPAKQTASHTEDVADPSVIPLPFEIPVIAPRNKAEIQRELLQLKRKALVLRRQGEAEEAEEVLKMAQVLETQMEVMTVPKKELLLDSTRDVEPDGVGSLISQEKLGNMEEVEEVTKGAFELSVGPKVEVSEISMGFGWNEHNMGKPPGSSAIFTPQTSQPIEDNTPLVAILDPLGDMRVAEHKGSFPQSGQSVNLMDLLTGDDWQSSQLPVEEVKNEGDSTKITALDNLYVQPGTSRSPNNETGSKDEVLFGKREKTVSAIEKIPINSSDFDSQNSQSSLQHEIVVRKRKAVSLKREGKLAEAREELRQAKLLEKSIQEYNTQPDAGPIDVSTSNDTSVVKVEQRKMTDQTPKPMTGRDRFKLQQESLAHKRQALKLRRDGRMEEADAELELAKALEAQLEGSPGHDSSNFSKPVNETETMDDLGVEDFLDPQLLSSLKAIGLQDVELVSRPPERSEAAKQSSANREYSSQERIQLEERIKAEKVKAINLKRAGKQAEALDALRRSKQFEKKLNSLAS